MTFALAIILAGRIDQERVHPKPRRVGYLPREVLVRWGRLPAERVISSYRGRSEIAAIAVLSIAASTSDSGMRPP
jgi:hypothetical protein